MAHIHLLGTSHIASKSVQDIRKAVEEIKPDIVAVELDRQRLHSLLHQGKTSRSPKLIKHVGLSGYLFAVIGAWLQKKLGRMVGMQPGADMLEAVKQAKKHNIPLLLLDRDISITLKTLSKNLTRKEKWRFFTDLFFGWAKKSPKVKIDLKEVPEEQLITKLIAQLKNRYPTFYDVLVHQRNEFMTRRLVAVARKEPEKTILAIIGAGHREGMQHLLATKYSAKETTKTNNDRSKN